jgi:hypothetical protein
MFVLLSGSHVPFGNRGLCWTSIPNMPGRSEPVDKLQRWLEVRRCGGAGPLGLIVHVSFVRLYVTRILCSLLKRNEKGVVCGCEQRCFAGAPPPCPPSRRRRRSSSRRFGPLTWPSGRPPHVLPRPCRTPPQEHLVHKLSMINQLRRDQEKGKRALGGAAVRRRRCPESEPRRSAARLWALCLPPAAAVCFVHCAAVPAPPRCMPCLARLSTPSFTLPCFPTVLLPACCPPPASRRRCPFWGWTPPPATCCCACWPQTPPPAPAPPRCCATPGWLRLRDWWRRRRSAGAPPGAWRSCGAPRLSWRGWGLPPATASRCRRRCRGAPRPFQRRGGFLHRALLAALHRRAAGSSAARAGSHGYLA